MKNVVKAPSNLKLYYFKIPPLWLRLKPLPVNFRFTILYIFNENSCFSSRNSSGCIFLHPSIWIFHFYRRRCWNNNFILYFHLNFARIYKKKYLRIFRQTFPEQRSTSIAEQLNTDVVQFSGTVEIILAFNLLCRREYGLVVLQDVAWFIIPLTSPECNPNLSWIMIKLCW